MKLNIELLKKIMQEVGNDNVQGGWGNLTHIGMVHYFPEVCRRYSEQIIKCDMCDGNGERERYHETLGDCPMICSCCEGEGYLKD